VNFALYYSLLGHARLEALRDVEFRVYLSMAAFAAAVVAVDIYASGIDTAPVHALFDATFQVVSLLTTTGFATADFSGWPGFAHATLLSLMFVGGCAGSTAGGAKVIRLLIGAKVALREVRLTFSPNSVVAITVGDQVVPEESQHFSSSGHSAVEAAPSCCRWGTPTS
jgi:trk system potassium uptake protein TrkH